METGIFGTTVDDEDSISQWTLEQLAKFVVIGQQWPLFLVALRQDTTLLRAVQRLACGESAERAIDSDPPLAYWSSRSDLRNALRLGCCDCKDGEDDDRDLWSLAEVDVDRILRVSGQVRRLTEEPTQFDHTPDESVIRYWINRPSSFEARFVDRQREFDAISSAFEDHRAVVIAGVGGIGKSQLAAEFTYTTDKLGFWTQGGADTSQTLAALAQSFGIDTEDIDEEMITYVRRRLDNAPDGIIWVIDNLPSLAQVSEILGVAGSSRLIITSRDARRHLLPDSVEFLILTGVGIDASLALLRSAGGIPADHPVLNLLAELADGSPLTLNIIVDAFVNSDPDDLLARLEAEGLEALFKSDDVDRPAPTQTPPQETERVGIESDHQIASQSHAGEESESEVGYDDETQKRLTFYEEMAFHLAGSSSAFRAQLPVRDELVALMKVNRPDLDPVQPIEELFRRYGSELDDKEKKLCESSREITVRIYDHNRGMLDLLEENQEYSAEIQHFSELREHLGLWVSKYHSEFERNDGMCLVYVGVEEGKPFSSGIDAAVRSRIEVLTQERNNLVE